MKKKRELSLVNKLIGILLAIIVMLVISVASLLVYSIYNVREQVEKSTSDYLDLYCHNLDAEIAGAEMVFEMLLYDNSDYETLGSNKERDVYMAVYHLTTQLKTVFAYNSAIDAIVVSESSNQVDFGHKKAIINYNAFEEIRAYNMECANQYHQKARWEIKEIGGVKYITKVYVWSGRAVGIYMILDNALETAGSVDTDMQLMAVDSEGVIQQTLGEELSSQSVGDVFETPRKTRLYSVSKTLDKMDMQIAITNELHMSAIQNKTWMVMLAGVLIVTLAVVIWLRTFLRREVLVPLEHMRRSMEEQKLDVLQKIENVYPNAEFETLRKTYNELMDEIVDLRIEAYEKQISLAENELKAVKLQLRPHFFLNTLTSISSLSMQKKNEDIQTFIASLSKNVRYMFKSGLHTVHLEEELAHVENFFEMQELKFPGCVFYSIECEDAAKGWNIPQMVIHTIIENEYKYAVSIDRVLVILIKVSLVDKDGEQMLLIEIEDDGSGYPEEVLEQFEHMEIKQDGTRVGLSSIRRMLYLMYEKEDLFQIGNVSPHGCINRIWIPREVVNEVKQEV